MFERFCTVCSERTVFSKKPPTQCPHCEAPYPPEIFSAATVEVDDFPSEVDDTPSQNASGLKNFSQQQTKTLDPNIQISPSEAMTILTDSQNRVRTTVNDLDLDALSINQLIPGSYFGKYQILEKIAQGGMGAVFKVFHPLLHQRFALKVLLTGQNVSEHQLARFHQEAKSCSRIRHKHIVSVHDVGEINGIHYLTMDLIEGADLSNVLYRKSFEVKEAVILIKKICEALAYAHAENILHRDLKPGNILIDLQGEPYVTDFGLAKDISKKDHLTQEGAILGTPAYMPPEQATGELLKIGPPSDIYSLGAIFYEVLTGRCPLMGETSIDLFHKILNVEPEPIRKINPKIPQDLETICLKCLSKEPKDRYPQMKDLLVDLTNYLEGRPIKARPVTPWERGWKLMKRHKLFSTTVFVFSMLLLFVLLSLWGLSQEKKHLLEIQQQIAKLFEDVEKLQLDPQGDIHQIRGLYTQALALEWDHHKTYLRLVQFLSGRGLYQDAILEIQNGLKRYPDWSEGYRELAFIYQRTNQLKEYKNTLEKFYQLAVRIEGSSEDLFLKAYQATQENKIDEALQLYEEVLKKNPAMIEARHHRAQLLMQKKLFPAARRDLDSILKENPNLLLPLLTRARLFLNMESSDENTQNARNDLNHILQMNVQIPEVWLLLIQTYDQELNLQGIHETLKQALTALPDHPLLLQEQGKIEFRNGNFPEAIASFQWVLKQDPSFKECYYFLALICKEQEQWEQALQSIQQMISISSVQEPLTSEVQTLFIFLLCQLGHRDGLITLKKFFMEHPLETELPEEYLILFMKKALDYGEEALFETIAQASLKKSPSHGPTQALLARKASYSGEGEQQKKFLEKAKKRCHGKFKETLWMIRFYLEENDIPSAEELLLNLQKMSPNHPEALKIAAEVFFAKKQWDAALESIQLASVQKALKSKKEWPAALSLEGLILCAQENAEGIQRIEEALQKGGVAYKIDLGKGLFLLKQWDEGWEQFLVSSDYFFEEFGLLAATFALQKKDYLNTLASLETVLKYNPNSFPSLLLKAKCLMQQDQHPEAKKVLELAKKRRPYDPQLSTLFQELKQD
ncbi:MAG: tetratricopeptide repeat protein [Planctomycetota bacterium]